MTSDLIDRISDWDMELALEVKAVLEAALEDADKLRYEAMFKDKQLEAAQAENAELKADAATHDEQLTKVACIRLELESENIRLQAENERLREALDKEWTLYGLREGSELQAIAKANRAALAATGE